MRVYGGSVKRTRIISFVRDMKNHKIGEFEPTKKLGKSIHDSERNKKKKQKKQK